MIDARLIREFIDKTLSGSQVYLVDVRVSPQNLIEVEIDSDNPVAIEECERLTRAIEGEFDRDKEDYILEVGSAGITSPLKVKRQYKKYIGKEMEVVLSDGKKLKGVLKSADEDGFIIVSREKVKKPDSKRPVMEDVEHPLKYEDTKQTKYLLKF